MARGRGGRREGGFTGFETAAAEEILAAVAVLDPFRLVRVAGGALNDCRRVLQTTPRLPRP